MRLRDCLEAVGIAALAYIIADVTGLLEYLNLK